MGDAGGGWSDRSCPGTGSVVAGDAGPAGAVSSAPGLGVIGGDVRGGGEVVVLSVAGLELVGCSSLRGSCASTTGPGEVSWADETGCSAPRVGEPTGRGD